MGKICIFTHFLDWNFRIGDNGDVIERVSYLLSKAIYLMVCYLVNVRVVVAMSIHFIFVGDSLCGVARDRL